MRTNYPWWKAGERLFERQAETKRRLKLLEGDAIYRQRSLDGMPHGNAIGDPTASGGLRLCSPKVSMMYREVRAVEAAYSLLERVYRGPDKVRLMRLIFSGHCNSMMFAAARVGINYSTAKNWKKEAMLLLAKQMEWI